MSNTTSANAAAEPLAVPPAPPPPLTGAATGVASGTTVGLHDLLGASALAAALSPSASAAPAASSKDDGAVRANVQKWGTEVMAAGYTLVPNVLIDRQRALGLDSVDLNILLVIISHWWTADSRAFLSKETIATAVGRSARTVQRRVNRMKSDGILDTIARVTATGRRTANAFDLSKLATEAVPFAKELLETRKRRAAESKARRLRKRPIVSTKEDDGE
jgi:biotin operon repressor